MVGVEYRYYEPGNDRPEDFKPRRSMRVHIAIGESRFPLSALCGITLRMKPVPNGYYIRYRALPEEPDNERLCRSCARAWNSREDRR